MMDGKKYILDDDTKSFIVLFIVAIIFILFDIFKIGEYKNHTYMWFAIFFLIIDVSFMCFMLIIENDNKKK